jgi:hypothetical protein
MKRFLISTVVVAAMAMAIGAPSDAAAQVAFGVKGGVNLGSLGGDDADFYGVDEKNRLGFAVGGQAIVPINDMFSFRPEVLFAMKGAFNEASTGSGEFEINFSYIDVPLLLQVNIPMEGVVNPNIFIGPTLSYILSAKAKTSGFPGEADTDEDIKDDLKSLDYGITLGVGAVVAEKFTIDARYTLGLATIDDSDDQGDIKN